MFPGLLSHTFYIAVIKQSGNKTECNLLNSAPELCSLTMSLICVFSSASHTCASVYWPHGSRFDLKTGIWKTEIQYAVPGCHSRHEHVHACLSCGCDVNSTWQYQEREQALGGWLTACFSRLPGLCERCWHRRWWWIPRWAPPVWKVLRRVKIYLRKPEGKSFTYDISANQNVHYEDLMQD